MYMNNKCICEECDLTFENVKIKANHVRWNHRDNSKFYENIITSNKKSITLRLGEIKPHTVGCDRCGKIFTVNEREFKFPSKNKYFCSKLCSSRYSQSFVDVNKISTSLKRFYVENPQIKPKTYEDRKCVTCQGMFNVQKCIPKKTCSYICSRKLVSKNSRLNPNCGGETNYKKFRYNNIWMDSSWEVDVAKFLDDNNIIWERSRKHCFLYFDQNNVRRRYYPDFYLPEKNLYVDPKNKYKLKLDRYKLEQVIKEHKINLIYGLKNDVIDKLLLI